MDPIAHSLVGACLAETGLRHKSRFMTATVIIGANLPDIDAIATAGGHDMMYGFRRGWTHGVLAMVLLPAMLAGIMQAIDRRQRVKKPDLPPMNARWLWVWAYLSVWSHPTLDWLNTYGVRLLMPFDDTWFYGDALFIIDPWMWLSMAAAVVLSRSQAKFSIAAWSVLGLATTGLVVGTTMVPWVAKGVWLVLVALIIITRLRPEPRRRAPIIAQRMLLVLPLYILTMLAGTALARRQAETWFVAQGIDVQATMAGPLPADPFGREIIGITADEYHFAHVDWLADPPITTTHPPVRKGPSSSAIAAATAAAPGFAHWLRFPSYAITPHEGGFRVTIQDVRYHRMNAAIGHGVIDLDANLQVKSVNLRR